MSTRAAKSRAPIATPTCTVILLSLIKVSIGFVTQMPALLPVPIFWCPCSGSPSSKLHHGMREPLQLKGEGTEGDDECSLEFDPAICSQFKILTCASNACSQKRQLFGLDPFSTFSSLYTRKEAAGAFGVGVEESPCLGRCKLAPCVAVEHADYVGTVGLQGMSSAELNDRVFHKVITEDDCDRVWQSVATGIQMMAENDDDDDDDDEA